MISLFTYNIGNHDFFIVRISIIESNLKTDNWSLYSYIIRLTIFL